jgi:hypothetical protein
MLGVSVQSLMQPGGCADFYVLSFEAMYMPQHNFAMDLTKEHLVYIKFYENSEKCDGDPGND